MTKKNSLALKRAEEIERKIYIVRGLRVMIDANIADMYEVPTKALNQAVTRNPERFPEDFSFVLTEQEFNDLKSQHVAESWDYGGRRYEPRVFTEQGVAMLSGLLRSPMAVKVNIEIIRAFVRIRRLLATPGDLVTQLTELVKTVQLHDHQIKAISDVLHQMLSHPEPVKPMGFHTIHPKKGT